MAMRWICRGSLLAFAVLYVLALALLVIGTFGLFGNEADPLAGVFLMPLGLPWNLMLDAFPARLWPWLAAAMPALNILILWLICRLIGSARHS